MRRLSRFMLTGAMALSPAIIGCESDSGTTGTTTGTDSTDGTADQTDATDGGTDTTPDAGTDSTDGTDGATDTTDGTDGATDATDGTTDATDGTTDGTDGTTDATDGTTDGTDGTTDSTEGTDGTDGATDSTDGVDGTDNGACNSPPVFGAAKSRVVSITIPPDAAAFSCDANGDGTVDAKDGNLNTALGNFKAFFDANKLLAQNVAEGDVVLLTDINGSWLNMYVGTKVDPAGACFDIKTTPEAPASIDDVTATTWDGSSKCDYGIDPKSYAEDGCPVISISGASLADGKIAAGPADFDFSLPLGDFNLDVSILNGQVNGAATGNFRLENGRLCGEIPFTALEAAFKNICSGPSAPDNCGLLQTAPAIIKGSCNNEDAAGEKTCTIVVGLETAEAGTLTLDAE